MIQTVKKQNDFTKGALILIAGYPKSGKSTAIASWGQQGDTLTLDFEGSMDHIPGAERIRVTSLLPPMYQDGEGEYHITPPEERGYVNADGTPQAVYSYVEAMDYLKANWDKLGYKNLAYDTIDAFVSWVDEIALEEIKEADAMTSKPKYSEAISLVDIEYGMGYARSRAKTMDRTLEAMELVRSTGQVIMAVHLENTITIRDGKNVIPQRKMAGIPEKLGRWFNGVAEAICLVIRSDSGAYTSSFDGHGETILGSRLPQLQGKTLPFTQTGKTSLYNQIMKTLKGEEKDVRKAAKNSDASEE